MSSAGTLEQSRAGLILVPPDVPPRFALFYTSADFDGRLTDAAVANLQQLLRERFSVEARLSTCHQIHSANVRRGRNGDREWCELDECDALWSDEARSALGIKVADCLPVTLIDPASGVIANIHAGWRGSAAGIVGETMNVLRTESRFDARAAHVLLGPAIRQCCFEVGEEVVEAFSHVKELESFVDRTRGERPYLDVVGINRALLKADGIADEAIWDSGICTKCDTRFHSYRRDRSSAGRNLAIVAVE